MGIYDLSGEEFNKKLAEALKENEHFKMPEWVLFTKTGTNKVRPPFDDDFWYKRAASIIRQVAIRGVVGVQRLRNRYGGKKDRGSKPSEFRKSGGKIIRIILQQAERAGLLEKSTGKKVGRKLTLKGKHFLEAIK
jgi:small subunit ribosomal protein S19e